MTKVGSSFELVLINSWDISQVFSRALEGRHREALLNGVALNERTIVLAAGGWDVVMALGEDGVINAIYGGKYGVGKGQLKEPVGVFSSPEGLVFVADWHNHRIVILNNELEYVDEFGHIGLVSGHQKPVKKVWWYLRALWSPGSYALSHFKGSVQSTTSGCATSLSFPRGFADQVRRHGGLFALFKYVLNSSHEMNKPNGVSFSRNHIVITQKNNRCISVYEKDSPYRLVQHIFNPKEGVCFGRLGNIHFHNNQFYVCDERSNRIWVFSENFSLVSELIGEPSNTTENAFLPFSCCMIDEVHLAVCGGKNIQLINTVNSTVVATLSNHGELHGIAFDSLQETLYVVDRLSSRLLQFEVRS